MKEQIKKYSKRTGHILGEIVAVVAIFLLIAMGGLYGFSYWLGTEKGTNWLAVQMKGLMEDTPYDMTIKGFAFNGLLGLGADNIELRDDNGVFLTLNEPKINVEMLPISLKQLWVDVKAENAVLYRAPLQSEADNPADSTLIPERPDVPLSRFVLNVDVENLELKPEVISGGAVTSVEGRQDITFGADMVEMKGQLDIDTISGGDMVAYIPETARYQLSGLWGGNSINLQGLEVKREGGYTLGASGRFDPYANALELKINGDIQPDMHSALTDEAELKIGVSGALNDYSGHVDFKGKVEGQALTLATSIKGNREKLHLANIQASAEGADINGQVAFLLNQGLQQQGQLNIDFENMNLIRAFSGVDNLNGRARVNLKFDVEGGRQIYSGDVQASQLIYDDVRLNKFSLTALPTENKNRLDVKIKIDGFYKTGFNLAGNGHVNIKKRSALIDTMTLNSGPVDVDAHGSLSENNLDMTLNIKNLDPTQAPLNVAYFNDNDVRLENSTIKITGTPAAPVISGIVRARQTAEDAIYELTANSQYQSGSLNSKFEVTGSGIEYLNGQVKIPMQVSLSPAVFKYSENAQLSGDIDGRFDLAVLTDMFLPRQHELSGLGVIDASISGTVSQPLLNGRVRIADGQYINTTYDVRIQNIDGGAGLNGRNITIDNITADDGANGTMKITGNINLANFVKPVVNIDAIANNMVMANGPDLEVLLDADTQVITQNGIYQIIGTISADNIRYILPEQFDKRIPELNIVKETEDTRASLLNKIQLKMIFDSRENIYISGWGLDVKMGGQLFIEGTADEPEVRGSLNAVRGTYEEFGRRFELSDSSLRFQGPIPPSPYLNINAVTEVEDITAQVMIRGSVKDPEIEFTSTPSLANNEILALILFGKDTSQISPFQALQLASTLRRFSGKGAGLDPLGEIQKATGLDDLRIEGGSGEGVTVGAGKYLSDDVYLEVQQGSEEGAGAARVEVELTPNITVESEVGARGEAGGGIFWEWDY